MMPKLLILITFVATVAWASPQAKGQCEACPHANNADYCYTDSRFDGFCAGFTKNKPSFQFFEKENDKKPDLIPLPQRADTDSLLAILQANPKLSAHAILFMAEAISQWQQAKNFVGLKRTESGLGYQLISEGSGPKPIKGKNVTVHYKGYLANGSVFDSSYDRGQPATFPIGIGRLIKGWDEGIPMFNEGSKILLVIPPELGYGSRETPKIPANSTLFFEIEIIKAFQE